jgi:Fur family ferric uptake transcriptional regulator
MITKKRAAGSVVSRPAEATPLTALRARGKRLTRPRRVILDAVRASLAHPSATAVFRQVRRRLPRVSLATVYRNLRMLAAEGLLTERADLAGMRFDGNTAPHDHFTCVACGRIYDVPPLGARGVRERVASRTGFEVLTQRIEFYGRCSACRRAGGSTRPPARRSHGRQELEGDQEPRQSEGRVRR